MHYNLQCAQLKLLLSVQNVVWWILYQVGFVVLVRLVLSVTFGNIDHSFHLSCLYDFYGIHDQAIVCISSLSYDRLQRVNIKGSSGVSQGSELGPILYYLYTKPVSDIVRCLFCCIFHMLMTRNLHCFVSKLIRRIVC